MISSPSSPNAYKGFANLVATALDQNQRAGLSQMLRAIAEAVDAQGCILWQEAPFSQNQENAASGELFVLADWSLLELRCDLHNLPLGHSATGEAVRTGTPFQVEDAKANPLVDAKDPFLQELGVRTFCSLPIRFPDGERGALNVYRSRIELFSQDDLDHLAEMITHLPRLYQTVSDKVSYSLVGQINLILQEAKQDDVDELAQKICQAVANTFQAVEASLFLNNIEEPECFKLRGTTWKFKGRLPKTSYHPSKEEGLTGYVLAQREPVRIFDLRKFDQERERIRCLYSGIVWGDAFNIDEDLPYQLLVEEGLGQQLKDDEKQRKQPLSFMAVPVIAQGYLFGALRCCTVKEGPFYFAQRDVKLLQLVAGQIGQAWSTWLRSKELSEENIAWQKFIKGVSELNRFVREQVLKTEIHESKVYEQARNIAFQAIPNANAEVHRVLASPVNANDRNDGRVISDYRLPRHARAFAELLGQQLPLYRHLFHTVSQLRHVSQSQAQTFEDFTHQLKSPINQVHVRSQICTRLADGRLETHLLALRGLAAKAKAVTRSFSLFAQLAEGKPLKLNRSRLHEGSLIKTLIEAAIDQKSTLDPALKIDIHVEREGFAVLRTETIEADPDLLFQAVSNVIDNATKYCFPETEIRIFGGLTGRGRFHISVINTGIRLPSSEIRDCKKRGWRSEASREVTGQGSGIGLWIVDHIMKAHQGQLVIIPTDGEDRTEVKLVFPRWSKDEAANCGR